MRTVIFQPAYIPWLGYFDLISKADTFVFYDDVQFTKQDWRTRNRIRIKNGWIWLSVPVYLNKSHLNYKINEVKIDYKQNWQKKHLESVKQNYFKSPFFNDIYSLLEKNILKKYEYLSDLDINIIFDICDYLGISKSKFKFSSEINLPDDLQKTKRLLAVINKLDIKTTRYLSANASETYLDLSLFEKENIKIEWHNYQHPYYHQNIRKNDIFISHLSAIDILFFHGKESLEIISGKKIIYPAENIKIIMADDCKSEQENKNES